MKDKLQNHPTKGWINGFMGVVIFSGSLPATKLAVTSFDPIFLTTIRATIAGILALLLLCALKEKKPTRSQVVSLIIIAIGVVVGFPLFTALALQHVTSAHSIVFLALLPLCTAIFGVIRGNELPKKAFWLFSIIGSLLVMGFAFSQGAKMNLKGDLFMIIAVIVCGLGYAEGAKLTKVLGGWQVISWALVISLPLMILIALISMPETFSNVTFTAWMGLGYISLFSMLIGFIFWYKGLAEGGIAAVGQLQLLQPFFGLILSAWLLGESINALMILCTIGVILCVIGSKKFAK